MVERTEKWMLKNTQIERLMEYVASPSPYLALHMLECVDRDASPAPPVKVGDTGVGRRCREDDLN